MSKEFVRRWLIENGFQGKEGQQIPEMNEEYVASVSERYIELYENILGEKFVKSDISNIEERIYLINEASNKIKFDVGEKHKQIFVFFDNSKLEIFTKSKKSRVLK